jgi:mono/diheme cytochrome c family protein
MTLRTWFYIVNFGLAGSLAWAAAVDYHRDWRKYQSEYYAMSIDAAQKKLATASSDADKASLQAEIDGYKHRPVEIKQILVNDLGKVDRCVTCHVGMDEFTNPTLANDFTKNPYKAHPDISKLIKAHPFRKFGCTECHEGQGLATSLEEAHGDVEFWEKGVRLQPFVQASCAKCHAGFEHLKGAEQASMGRKLFEKNGCIGCHSINGQGGIISVDLGDIADKPTERISAPDFARAKMPAEYAKVEVKNWILAHLTRDPLRVVRNDPEAHFNKEPIAPSGMPPFFESLQPGEAEAIATYLLSLTHESIPKNYYVFEAPKGEPKFASAADHGHFVFQKYGCAACHGIDAKQGRRLFNGKGPGQDPSVLEKGTDEQKFDNMAMGREPTLVETVGTFNREELIAKIQNGVAATAIDRYNAAGPLPPAFMPPWKDKIKGKELDDLVTWLQSIGKKQEAW